MKNLISLALFVCSLVFTRAPLHAATLINGAGASFPYPIYSKWFDEYAKIRPGVQFNYQAIGSGGGIRQVLALTVDFGGTDVPMTEEQIKNAKGSLLHLPTVIGAVVPTYHLPDVQGEIRFTPHVLANIYLGKITRWNDPELAKANPSVKFPDKQIAVIRRSDGSGTTYVWVEYLSKVSQEWKDRVGVGASVKWPVGLGGKGNEGVSGMIKSVPYSIGYVELIYAEQNHLPIGAVQNQAGEFVKPSLANITAAAALAKMPEDFRVSITNATGKTAYPIASFTWLLIPRQIADPVKGRAIVDFLKWMLREGQALAPSLSYAPLPREVIQMEEAALVQIRY